MLANANVARLPATALGATTMEMYGTKGSLLTDPWSDAPVEVLGTDLAPIPATRPANAHFPMIDDFARAVVEGRTPRFSGEDGLWATAVIAGTYESARSGRVIAIDAG